MTICRRVAKTGDGVETGVVDIWFDDRGVARDGMEKSGSYPGMEMMEAFSSDDRPLELEVRRNERGHVFWRGPAER